MNRTLRIAIGGLCVATLLLVWLRRAENPDRVVESREMARPAAVLAALGRVEGRGQTISLGAATDGVVKEVLVTDGQRVEKGALLAVIGCDDVREQINLAKAQAESARQARVRLLRGKREEEREAAARATEAAKAVLTAAQEHLNRMEGLYQNGEISRDTYDQTKRDFDVASADYQKAVDEQALTDARPLPEEISQADAEVAAAQRNVEVAADKLEKCNVRAPISGTVLKVLTKAGESYSTLLPNPLFTMADDSVRRVRAEVDERDIGKVKIGQESIVTADAYPGQKFEGQVIEISRAMEAKAVVSADPADKTDRDVLDVVIELKPAKDNLPLGLRVTTEMTGAVSAVAPEAPVEGSARPAEAPVAKAQAMATAAEAATTAVPAAPSAPATTEANGFLLQAGAMKKRENADTLASALQRKDFPAFVRTRDGDPFYRVDVGPYPDLAAAMTAKNDLKGGGFETIMERPRATRQ